MMKQRILFGLLLLCLADIDSSGEPENISLLIESTTQISSNVEGTAHLTLTEDTHDIPINKSRAFYTNTHSLSSALHLDNASSTEQPATNTVAYGFHIHTTVDKITNKGNPNDVSHPTQSGTEQHTSTQLLGEPFFERDVQADSTVEDSVGRDISTEVKRSEITSFATEDDQKTVHGPTEEDATTLSAPLNGKSTQIMTRNLNERDDKVLDSTIQNGISNSVSFAKTTKLDGESTNGGNEGIPDTNYKRTTNSAANTTVLENENTTAPFEVVLAEVTISGCNSNQFCMERCGSKPEQKSPKPDFQSQKSVSLLNTTKQVELVGDLCLCDKQCVIYGDCCPDFFESCMKINQTEETVNFISKKIGINHSENRVNEFPDALRENRVVESDVIDGILNKFGSCNKDINEGVFLVDKCPETSIHQEIIEKCENVTFSLLPPVTAIFYHGKIPFKNVFCARCHGINERHLTAWTHQFHCIASLLSKTRDMRLDNFELTKLVQNGVCSLTFQAPFKQRSNCDDLESEIEMSIKEGNCSMADGLLCKSYNFPTAKRYKNPHCEKCLTAQFTEKNQGNLVCNSSFRVNYMFPTVGGNIEGGILIILDIFGKYSVSKKGEVVKYDICSETQVYDPLTQECKILHCPAGYQAYKGKCEPFEENHFVDKVSQLFPDGWNEVKISFKTRIPAGEVCTQLKHYVNEFELKYFMTTIVVFGIPKVDTFEPDGLNNKLSRIECSQNVIHEERDGLTHVDIYLSLKQNPDVGFISELTMISEILNRSNMIFKPLDKMSEIEITNLFNMSDVVCPEGGNLKTYDTFSVEVYNDTLYVVLNSTDFKIFYPFHNIGYNASSLIDTEDFLTYSNTVTLCEESTIFSQVNCSIVAYQLNETLLNGSRLFVLKSGRFYEQGQFEIGTDLIYVCSDLEFETEKVKATYNLVYYICGYLFTSIAATFLIAMLVIYCSFPELRTLPGKMTASLAGSMLLTFLFNLVTLEDVHNEFVCPFLAALAHLFTLAHFGWMSAIAVDMALTFGSRSLTLTKNLHDEDAFVRYNAVVWGFSAAIVMTSVVLDVIHPDKETTTNTETEDLNANNTTRYDSDVTWDSPRYGYPKCTWFSGPLWTRLAFILIPFTVTFIINIVAFVLTLVGIERTSISSQRAGNRASNRARCIIYVKLSTAMGFMWILPLVNSALPENQVMPYILLVLILLQGLFLFLAFMTNKTVTSLILKKIKSEKSPLDSSHLSSIATSQSKSM